MRVFLSLAVLSVASAAKLSTMMSSNTFIQNSDLPKGTGNFVVWNDQAWHYGDESKLRIWQSSTQTWKDVTKSVFGNFPSPRSRARFVVAHDRFFLHGGVDANGKLIPLSDNFYSFDPASSFEWSKLDYIGETIPYLRSDYGYVGHKNKTYLFGGIADWPSTCQTETGEDCGCSLVYAGTERTCMLNDLYEYSPESGIWKALDQTGAVKPCERMEFAFAAGQDKLFVLGGTTVRTNVPGAIGIARWTGLSNCGEAVWGVNGMYRIQDLWSYDLMSNEWSALAPPVQDVGISPGLAFHGHNLYAIGGFNGKDPAFYLLISSRC